MEDAIDFVLTTDYSKLQIFRIDYLNSNIVTIVGLPGNCILAGFYS
jgi:hypothetical protein